MGDLGLVSPAEREHKQRPGSASSGVTHRSKVTRPEAAATVRKVAVSAARAPGQRRRSSRARAGVLARSPRDRPRPSCSSDATRFVRAAGSGRSVTAARRLVHANARVLATCSRIRPAHNFPSSVSSTRRSPILSSIGKVESASAPALRRRGLLLGLGLRQSGGDR